MFADSKLKVQVSKRTDLCGDIMMLDLVAMDGKSLPAFEAGAHIDVKVNDEITRQYSLCNDPARPSVYRLGVLRDIESRGGSAGLHDNVFTGDNVEISTPKNNFPLISGASFSLLVGGGIGITPMIAMAHQLQAEGKDFRLHYCITGPDKAAFLEQLLASPFSDKVRIHYDQSDEGEAFSPSTDIPPAGADVHLYTCGPTGFMDWILSSAAERGYHTDNLHKEDFSAEVDMSGEAFIVEAQQSGKMVEVKDGQSIAAALAAVGIKVDVSCEEGICGTCLSDVLEGEIDHRDHYLTDEEKEDGDLILVCCSRAKSKKLVLDL